MITKQRNRQHLIDEEGCRLLAACLPAHWVLRPYRPDYGLDFSVEIFGPVQPLETKPTSYETLGEHLLIQLKSTTSSKVRNLKLFSRYNVEKRREILDRDDTVGTMSVVTQRLEATELATIDRMGAGAPVLLVIADLTEKRCYFVCVNDYIDKILTPRFGNDTFAKSRSIDIPIANFMVPGGRGAAALGWYGKRVKLYAAFQKFVYQNSNLQYEESDEAILEMAQHFATRIARYDFWDDTLMWTVIGFYGKAVRHFLESGDALGLNLEPGITPYERARRDGAQKDVRALDVLRLWQLLALLPSNYEDVCREWFLPTALGYLAGQGSHGPQDSLTAKYSSPNTVKRTP